MIPGSSAIEETFETVWNTSIENANDARTYLAPNERHVNMFDLPKHKFYTLMLVERVKLRQNPLPMEEIYHVFGYLGCRAAHEEQLLGGLYRALLWDVEDRVVAFAKFAKAVKNKTLLGLFHKSKYLASVRRDLPLVFEILQYPPARQPSVFKLMSFIRSDNIEPHGILRRDYGFQNCRGSAGKLDVENLKCIYRVMLKKSTPMAIHEACIRGKLYEFGLSLGIGVE